MGFLKKNLLFFLGTALCLVACITGLFFIFSASNQVEISEKRQNSKQTQLSVLQNADPAPTEENLRAAKQNLEQLEDSLAEIRADLQQGASLLLSKDGVGVIAGIQQYIAKYQRAVDAHINEEGKTVKIETPDNFAFGFRKYFKNAVVPDDPAKVAELDKQRQILSYLMTQLIASDPQAINSVQRELVESKADDAAAPKTFTIDPAITARVPGAIDTVAFSLTFSGYTDTLRDFLNRLSDFEMPIVVRSIEVQRPSGNGGGQQFASFGEPEAPDGQKPVVEDNISKFTVILEFIEVVLPDSQSQETSDPA